MTSSGARDRDQFLAHVTVGEDLAHLGLPCDTFNFPKKTCNKDIFSLGFKEKEKDKSKVCFLSGVERKVLSGGYSRLDCEYNREPRDVGPGSYKTERITSALHQTLNKVTSRVGYGGLASRTPRFNERRKDSLFNAAPAPSHKKCLIHVPKVRVGKTPPPFGSAVPRSTGFGGPKEDTPGFYYDISKAGRREEMPFDHTFGGRTRLRPHVVIKCTPQNTDTCVRCGQQPVGDYWYSNSCSGADYLCHPCYTAEWNTHPTATATFTRKQIQAFKKIRDCSFIHQHEGTTAAYPLMSDKAIWKQKVLECYFACFQGPRKIINTEPRGQAGQTRCQNGKVGRSKPKGDIQVLFKNPKNKTFVDL